jgi:7-carboxy-7-deazaguanine synthase
VTEKTYRVNEVFYSLQGEGVRAGTANVFVRFSGCNMRCDTEPGPKSPGGFQCDTEFESGRSPTLDELWDWVSRSQDEQKSYPATDPQRWLILTGGEPALQVDKEFCDYFHKVGYKLAIETNGSIELPFKTTMVVDPLAQSVRDEKQYLLDWITVSPKVAEHCIRQKWADEVKYVRGYGQGIPKTVVTAEHYLISPSFQGDQLDKETLQWCIRLCLENPKWRLSLQQHKTWRVR